MGKWHNLTDNKLEVPGNIFCVEPIKHNKSVPYTIEGVCKTTNGKTYIYAADGLVFSRMENGIFIDKYNGWMIRYYTDLPKLPKEAVNDFWAGYDNSSKKNLVENKIINEDT